MDGRSATPIDLASINQGQRSLQETEFSTVVFWLIEFWLMEFWLMVYAQKVQGLIISRSTFQALCMVYEKLDTALKKKQLP